MRLRTVSAKVSSMVGAAALVGAGLIALPATVGDVPAAQADTIDCAQLALGQPCTVRFEDHPGYNLIELPGGVDVVTVLLAGGSGAPADSAHAAPGNGGVVIASLDVSDIPALEVWLGDQGSGATGAQVGWAPGGDGGTWTDGNGGYGGGAASGLVYQGGVPEEPILVAGGGGGGAGNGSGRYTSYAGGAGGQGGLPAGDGLAGSGNSAGAGGAAGGSDVGTRGGEGHGGAGPGLDGSAGGGGGGGYAGGAGGGYGAHEDGSTYSTGGGGGGGTSYVSPLATSLGWGSSPDGPGWITIVPGEPTTYECNGSSERRELEVPEGVTSYAFFAAGGAGDHGNNNGTGGYGATVTGVLDVRTTDTLHYWVACSGAAGDATGHGYGMGGAGGQPDGWINSGGHGGGATAVELPDGTMLIAAGGGGGAGGEANGCEDGTEAWCGGNGGNGGGRPGTNLPADGTAGGDGDGGAGGTEASNIVNGQPDPSGAHGGESDDPVFPGGGGGGGGAGWPAGGGGGAHYDPRGGGGGGAGGSYFNPQYVGQGTIGVNGTTVDSPDLGNGYLMLIPIEDSNVPVTVRKTVTGDAGAYGQGPFTIQLTCRIGSIQVVDTTFPLGPHGDHVVQVPEGADCTATETGTGGATTPAAPQQFSVGADPLTVTMTNAFEATTLDIVVQSQFRSEEGHITDAAPIDPGDYGVSVSCRLDGHELALPAPVVNGAVTIDGLATFPPYGDGVTVQITGLPVGAECAVTEQPDAHATNVTYDLDGGSGGPGEWFPLLPGGSQASIENTYQLASLSISKVAGGDGTVPEEYFGGSIECTFNGSPVLFPAPPRFNLLVVGGTFVVPNLPVGAICTVTETETGGASAVIYTPAASVPIALESTQVTIENVFHDDTLTVQVNATGDGAHWANTPPTLHVECTDGGETVLDEQYAPDSPTAWTSYQVVDGAVCTVTEQANGGATAVNYASSADPTPSTDPVEVTVGPGGATLIVDNVFATAALDVSVTPTGAGTGFADPSSVTVQECTFNGQPIAIVGDATSVPFAFPAGGGSSGVPQLVVGAECVVVLTGAGGATSASIEVTNGDPHTTGDESATVTVNTGDTTVAFMTVFEVAGLTVDKILTGDGAWASNTAFAVQVTCTLDGIPIDQLGPDGTVTVRFNPDGSPIEDHARTALQTLPVAAECALDETQSGGATGVEYSANPVVIDAGGSTAFVQNTFAVGTLTVTKTVAGNGAASHTDTPFTFQLGCTFNGQPIGSPPSDTQPTTFHLVDGGSATFIDRPVGAECTVTEIETREATSVSPDVTLTGTIIDSEDVVLGFTNTFDVATLTVTEVLTGSGAETYGQPLTFEPSVQCQYADGTWATLPDGGRLLLNEGNDFSSEVLVPVGSTCSAAQDLFFATDQTVTGPVDVVLGDEHAITITSDYRVGELTVSKTAVGSFDAGQQFGFAITCTWPEGDVELPLNGNAPAEFALTSGNEHTVEALAYTTCTTTETSAAGAVRVVSDATGSNAVSGDTTASVVILEEVPAQVDVTNYMPGSLPVTGGELRTLVLIAGLFVLAGVAVVVIRRRVVRP